MKDILKIYHDEMPEFLKEFSKASFMQRLKDIGMNCGVQYTDFLFFKNIRPYSRYYHSLGVALIVYHFTKDIKQSLAGLFHDISTPVFSHTIDFLYGDYTEQSYTEKSTKSFITKDDKIMELLNKYNIDLKEVCDYHIYPIADNEGYKLSADRLEYSLANIVNYGFATTERVKEYYDDLIADINEFNEPELLFTNLHTAKAFTLDVLKNSYIYMSNEDRYAMEYLADIIKKALKYHILTENDLYTVEKMVIDKIKNSFLKQEFENYTRLNKIALSLKPLKGFKKIMSKKRYINPYVYKKGRIYTLDNEIKTAIDKFMNYSFESYLKGYYEE